MSPHTLSFALLALFVSLAAVGCGDVPGKPKPGTEAPTPEQVVDVATLYAQNCAGCHGDGGRHGAAISLANPVYLAYAGAPVIERVIATGVPGTMMPPFAKSSGGMLTEPQILILTRGMVGAWGKPADLSSGQLLPYAASGPGDSALGEKSYATFCARCHGANGGGVSGKVPIGSLVDPAYLALISDQGLRTFIVAGEPEQGMPDWRSDATGTGARAMTDQEVNDVVAWLAAHRTAAPGQPYRDHP
jgi:mono/diheme cytochrome c family protein